MIIIIILINGSRNKLRVDCKNKRKKNNVSKPCFYVPF